VRDLYPPCDATHQRGALATGKILARPRPQIGQNAVQQIFIAFFILVERDPSPRPDQPGEGSRQIGDWKHEIGAGGERVSRHRWEFGVVWVLHENDSALLLYVTHANGAVRAAATENDGISIPVMLGERAIGALCPRGSLKGAAATLSPVIRSRRSGGIT
jgi:hypothetical protein